MLCYAMLCYAMGSRVGGAHRVSWRGWRTTAQATALSATVNEAGTIARFGGGRAGERAASEAVKFLPFVCTVSGPGWHA